MIPATVAKTSVPVLDFACARGTGSREGNREQVSGRFVARMHLPHLGATTSRHATKREGGWDACL